MNEISPSSRRALWRHFESAHVGALAAHLCRLARRGYHDVLTTFADHPLADDWRDACQVAMAEHWRHRQGTVYVAANPVQMGWYKVGQTAGSLETRLKTLCSPGVVGRFVGVFEIHVPDRFAVEKVAHRLLSNEAVRHKEFFQTDHVTAAKAVADAARLDAELLTVAGLWTSTSPPCSASEISVSCDLGSRSSWTLPSDGTLPLGFPCHRHDLVCQPGELP